MSVGTAKVFLIVVVALSFCSLGFVACDGRISVKGRVYIQKSAAGDSQAFIDQLPPSNEQLSPLKDVKVTLYHAGDFSPEKAEKSELRKDSALTADDGSFEVGGLTIPFRFNAGLVIERQGYKPITKIFYHDKVDHDATIILVPEVSDRK
jgi:hypothetical protein